MATADTLSDWVDGYLTAWESNDPEDIIDLFTEDATYRFSPYDEPVTGHNAIVAAWLDGRDEKGTWSFEWHPVAIEGETAVLEGRTAYPGGTDYRNLWVIRFAPDGRAASFTEWYMAEADDE
jgi:ketosteroid isomerase-like protein